jgi:hypothetical protein
MEPPIRYKLMSEEGFAMEEENTAVNYQTFRRASKHVCWTRGATLKTTLRAGSGTKRTEDRLVADGWMQERLAV